jgi:hypothetical protein
MARSFLSIFALFSGSLVAAGCTASTSPGSGTDGGASADAPTSSSGRERARSPSREIRKWDAGWAL